MAKKQAKAKKKAAQKATAPKRAQSVQAVVEAPIPAVDRGILIGLILAAGLLIISGLLIWWSYSPPAQTSDGQLTAPVPLGTGNPNQLQSGGNQLQTGGTTGTSSTGDLNTLQPQTSVTPDQLNKLQ